MVSFGLSRSESLVTGATYTGAVFESLFCGYKALPQKAGGVTTECSA